MVQLQGGDVTQNPDIFDIASRPPAAPGVEFPHRDAAQHGHVVLVHDLAVVEQRGDEARLWTIIVLVGVVFLAAAFAVLVTVLLARRWLQSLRSAIDDVRLGGSGTIEPSDAAPFAREFRHLLRDLQLTDLSAEGPDLDWSPAMLRNVLAHKLPGAEVIVVSNEPYIHNGDTGKIVVQPPASGLVAALEPIMRACGGTWVAHGSGTADRETVDRFDRIRVPPDDPSYVLRRVWLTEEEQNGYYYGFANEGLWPLCHMAFVRPNFREGDWDQYKSVNARFAEAVVEEAKRDDPIVLVQDYHFALLPSMLRKRLAEGDDHHSSGTFPGPMPKRSASARGSEEIIAGLLGSSVIGFHTQFHCNNFLETVDRFMEARIDREQSFISFGALESYVRPYPISIEWPPAGMKNQNPCRSAGRRFAGVSGLATTCGSRSASSASTTPRASSIGCALSKRS